MIRDVGYVMKSLADLLWPERCPVCGRVLGDREEKICEECMEDMPLTRFWGWAGNPAEERLWQKIGIVSAASLYFYRNSGPYNILVQEVKYRGNLKLGNMLGRMLGERLKSSGRFDSLQAVIFVPLHPLRRWRRGYNQAEVEAQGVAEALGIPLVRDLLHRTRRTRTQTKLKGRDKEKNVKDAFKVNEKAALKLESAGITHLLMVDDVLTSGATTASAASRLTPRFLISVATVAFVE